MDQKQMFSWALVFISVLLVAGVAWLAATEPPKPSRDAAKQLFDQGNFKEAYDGYRALTLDPQVDPAQVGIDLRWAIQCLRQLGRVAEVDELIESAVAAQANNSKLLVAAAQGYAGIDHFGAIVAGKFQRGNQRGEGRMVNSLERDRVRALQLLRQANDKLAANAPADDAAALYWTWADYLFGFRGNQEAWRLQRLTDLDKLPDYEEGWWGGRQTSGAPVDVENNPVYYPVPPSFADATNDGQRWRWCLWQTFERNPQRKSEVLWTWGQFLHSQFGVQTMASFGGLWRLQEQDDKKELGTWQLDTLTDDEALAQLATGVKRFKLPDEYNPIKVFQQVLADKQGSYAANACEQLAQVYEDRRQYPRAAEYWRRAIADFGKNENRDARLNQIVGNWGRFESTELQPARRGASFEFRYRNAKHVSFEAHEINVTKLLADIKAYVQSNPGQLAWEKLDLTNIGYRLVEQGESKYVGARAAAWELELEPREKHFDRLVTVSTSLQKAGAYWVTARLQDGNTTHIVLWVADTAILKKPLDGKTWLYVGDAVTGAPIERANVEFFGFRPRHLEGRRFTIDTKNFAEFTDASGQIQLPFRPETDQFQWLIIARTQAAAGKPARLAFLGYSHIWQSRRNETTYREDKGYFISDRPVYRPNQAVKFKFWFAQARYDAPDKSPFANTRQHLILYGPTGDKLLEKDFTCDQYGGFDGVYELPSDARLGMYRVQVSDRWGGQFRVEEYKKPEYEVKVEAPTEPVMLGDKVTATITARYYFGAPVTKGTVKYRVLRTYHDERWYPIGPWDWLYGRGYGWFGGDYDWYPGWRVWGCPRPYFGWWPRAHVPPEVVLEGDAPLSAEGQLKLEIDTSLAKLVHGDHDHKYEITAEVTDESRRTIVGQGNVLVARKPFEVHAWLDRGWYRAGDTVRANFRARTLDDRPVEGTGKLALLKITYDDKRQPIETPVEDWDLPTNAQGEASQQIRAAAAGQYRLSYKVTDKAGHTIEGGYLFSVVGQGFASGDYRFSALEVIPEKREYRPGEKVGLMINTDRVGSTVLLFIRPTDGTYLPPRTLRLQAKSTFVEIEVEQGDMPNFFVEAVSIADARENRDVRDLLVPPEKRVVQVTVEPSAEKYRPGEQAKVRLKFTGLDGRPISGSVVATMYDKSVEYISGGSNVPDIKEFFWNWRRTHYPQGESDLSRFGYNIPPKGKPAMQNLGVFGGNVAEETDGAMYANGRIMTKNRRQGGMGGVAGRAMADEAMPLAAAAPMEAAAGAPGGAADARFAGALDKAGEGEAGAPLVEPTVRTKFADTAYWAAALVANNDGVAEFELAMPENLTTWKVRAWTLADGARVGDGSAEVVTFKNLLVRLQAPRFMVEKDEVVLSANIHNYLDHEKQATVTFELDGGLLEPIGEATQKITLAAGGESRVDFRVRVVREGEATIRVKALTDEESDATELKLPVYVHGMLKTESYAGTIRPDGDTATVELRVPEERRAEQTRLEVQYGPTLAGAMVDALPYLVNYPYGCTEQTLNRFLPTVITQHVLLDMKLDLAAIREKRTNLNPQELGDPAKRAEQWKRYQENPVFDEAVVRRMVQAGLEALGSMQLSDGGWGWFSGFGEHSDPHTTALVMHGLHVAAANDVAIVPDVLARGRDWLVRYQDEQVRRLQNAATKTEPYKTQADNIDALVYWALVEADINNGSMQEYLYRDRVPLSVYSKALFGLALHKLGAKEQTAMLRRNIEQFLVQDAENETAYLQLPDDNYWWYWYGSQTEAMAFYLKLLVATEPASPVAPRLVKYLLNNRKHATYWNSTRDTAYVVESFADYLAATGETKANLTIEVWLDGQKKHEVQVTPETLFSFDNRFMLAGDAVTAGAHKLELRKRGTGPLYFNAYLTNFTLEDPITAAGLEIKVRRKVYRLVREKSEVDVAGERGQVVSQQELKYHRELLDDSSQLKSGDLLEVELELDSKNDYEYLIFEDFKAAGCEAFDVRSGYTDNDLGAYVEYRDNRASFFVRRLARGLHSTRYRLRAEIPGRYSALPATGLGMYAPELKANSSEIKLRIED
ncbi:MAG: alpha-2-macroglobulin [Pirellulales bacterium]|nr:alpha-2-macroglobulin [Pirellulales bacterium]